MRCVSEDKEAYVESNSERRNSEKRVILKGEIKSREFAPGPDN
jgi:hypothetical protein